MKLSFGFLFFISINLFSQSKDIMHTYTYLALGDSYTVGESVQLHKSFPYQTVQFLRNRGYDFFAPEMIAQTGWTTDELHDSMREYKFLSKYDFVSILIGVNNQYSGKEVIQYKEQFEELLKKAIALANGKKEHVIVISIPDYSSTPFAEMMDREKISKEIDVFNTLNKALSIQYKVHYLDITPESRDAVDDPELVAADKLHPSSKEYAKWSVKLADIISFQLK